uniref:Metalloendopeptidase n=1 Tax=Kryptolebias marmoratus TaxID=37003 RepID=A0A3Q3AUR0_KRYMA
MVIRLQGNTFQLLLQDSNVFPGQREYKIPPMSSALGSATSVMCLENLQKEESRRPFLLSMRRMVEVHLPLLLINVFFYRRCRSYIGRKFANGQNLSIGAGCDSIAEFEHEILHALGFLHEQSRYDRDNHTQIFFKNIIAEHNFEKVSSKNTTTHETSYDYLSVMHYPKNAFTNGNEPTIITRDPKFQDVIGQRLDMSPGDVQELNLLYKCSKCLKVVRINSLTDKKEM